MVAQVTGAAVPAAVKGQIQIVRQGLVQAVVVILEPILMLGLLARTESSTLRSLVNENLCPN